MNIIFLLYKVIIMGIMQKIKELLLEGKTVKELTELGYKKPSIYKVKKQLKDIKPDNEEEPETKNFQKDIKPENINSKESTNEDNQETQNPDNFEPDNSISSINPDNINDEKEVDMEGISTEIFEDDEAIPFREYGGINIKHNNVNVPNILKNTKESITQKIEAGTEKTGVTELLTEIYGTVGILTGHDFWELSNKDQKVLKHLCKLPGLEKFLHKFGLYGCALSLLTITFKRIKMEIALNKSDNPEQKEQIQPEIIVRPDSPGHIMEAFKNVT